MLCMLLWLDHGSLCDKVRCCLVDRAAGAEQRRTAEHSGTVTCGLDSYLHRVVSSRGCTCHVIVCDQAANSAAAYNVAAKSNGPRFLPPTARWLTHALANPTTSRHSHAMPSKNSGQSTYKWDPSGVMQFGKPLFSRHVPHVAPLPLHTTQARNGQKVRPCTSSQASCL